MEVPVIDSMDEAAPAWVARLKMRVRSRLQLGLRSASMRYGLRRDLLVPLENPAAKIPIEVRPLLTSDVDALLPTGRRADRNAEFLEIAWRRAMIEKRPDGCFVAVDLRTNSPCYMQWLFGPRDRPFVSSLGGFPELAPDEALLENAYTPVDYRGLGIMPAAMALIAERAEELGARSVLTFVDEHNIPSLKGCQRAGFFVHMLHYRSQAGFGLLKRSRFETLPDDDPRRLLRF